MLHALFISFYQLLIKRSYYIASHYIAIDIEIVQGLKKTVVVAIGGSLIFIPCNGLTWLVVK